MNTNRIIKVFLSCCLLFCSGISCTDLDVPVYDKITDFWRTPEEISAGVAPAYSKLREYTSPFAVYALNEVCTDEIIVPNRITDWADGTVWEDLWKHTWQPGHPFIEQAWQDIYSGIVGINQILSAVNQINPAPTDYISIVAELKTVRAYYYFLALDLFGNVPLVDENTTDLSSLSNNTRAEVFNFVEKELKENLEALSAEVNPKTYGRATQWFAQTILAKLYLNAQVYTGSSRWLECIAACDAILSSENYSLENDFFINFKINNEASRENIFVIPFDRVAGLNIFWIQILTLHYNSGETFGLQWGGGANGFCSTADYLNLFDSSDIRKKMFLVGQQYKNQIASPVNLQYDRSGNLLIFDPVITSFTIQPPKTETAGARCAKWEFNKEGAFMSNDFAVYRLADIILMKAEAQFRSGDAANALITINQKINGVSIRSRTGLPDISEGEMNLDGLLAERARELSWEGHRRNDMIRFGHFTDARIPDKNVSESFRILFPIPRSVMENNKNLVQNPGY
ncbi:MAG: RagB/SusD family nutrient uptake outer membrane protein [Bacteroidales bacterium]